MSKRLPPAMFGDAQYDVLDPVYEMRTNESYYTDKWFGSSRTLEPVAIRFVEETYSATIRVNYSVLDGKPTSADQWAGIEAQIYLEAYDSNDVLLGTVKVSDFRGRDMGVYFARNGVQDPGLDIQGMKPITNTIRTIKIYCPEGLDASFICLAAITDVANLRALATTQAFFAEIERQKAIEEEKRQVLIDELADDYGRDYLDTLDLALLIRIKAQRDATPEDVLRGTTTRTQEELDVIYATIAKAGQDAVSGFKDAITLASEGEFGLPSTGGITPIGDPGPVPDDPYGLNNNTGGSTAIPYAAGGGGGGSTGGSSSSGDLANDFRNVFDPQSPELRNLQGKFAGVIQDYVDQRSSVLGSDTPELVQEIRLIRMILERYVSVLAS